MIRSLISTSALTFAAIVLWLHARRRDVDPATQGISHYAVGRTQAAMTIAFLALALGLVSAARVIVTSPVVWLRAAAVSIALVAVLPVSFKGSAPRRDLAHTIAALAFFLTIAIGTVVASASGRGPLLITAWAIGAFVATFLLSMARIPGLWSIRGWLQRGCFALVVVWLLLVAWI